MVWNPIASRWMLPRLSRARTRHPQLRRVLFDLAPLTPELGRASQKPPDFHSSVAAFHSTSHGSVSTSNQFESKSDAMCRKTNALARIVAAFHSSVIAFQLAAVPFHSSVIAFQLPAVPFHSSVTAFSFEPERVSRQHNRASP
jgi:hypothetical protein